MTFAVLAAVPSRLGREDEARAAVTDLLEHAPETTCARYRENLCGRPEAVARLVDALAAAGLPAQAASQGIDHRQDAVRATC